MGFSSELNIQAKLKPTYHLDLFAAKKQHVNSSVILYSSQSLHSIHTNGRESEFMTFQFNIPDFDYRDVTYSKILCMQLIVTALIVGSL